MNDLMMPATPLDFGWRALRWPLALSLFVACILGTTGSDLAVARWLFFDTASMQWRGDGSWWVNDFVHTGGGWLVRSVIVAAAVMWSASLLRQRAHVWRRPVGYFLVSALLSVGVVGLLKQLTNVDCPWDLAPFGGRFPYIPLFADRPEVLRAAHCFPAAHAGSAYALMAVYFALRERNRAWARVGLILTFVLGLIFGIAQQSRGAHFLSHDLCSATIAWCVSVTVYCAAFRCRLWMPVAAPEAPAESVYVPMPAFD
jgi:membrane-associated PAP2 superfamily phosphatase